MPDTRNTKVVDLVRTLRDFVGEVVIYDPMADAEMALHEYGIAIENRLPRGPFETVVLAVKHAAIAELGETGIRNLLGPNGLIYDLKDIVASTVSHGRL